MLIAAQLLSAIASSWQEALEFRFAQATGEREARVAELRAEAEDAEDYSRTLRHMVSRSRRGLNRVETANNRLKDALARTEALRVIAVRQLLANEEGAKQAATALERVRHDTSEAAAERHNALRYRPVAVPRNTRLQRKRCVATATAWIPHCR